MKYVIDCSSAFKWVVAETDTPKAIRLLDDFEKGNCELLAPDLFPTEIGNALLMSERRKRIGVGEGAVLFADVLCFSPILHRAVPLLPRAYEIAYQYQATIYDCLYVALAEREQCEFISADDKLVMKLQAAFPFVIALSSMP
jgi:predicted nucleic acid-binding protein